MSSILLKIIFVKFEIFFLVLGFICRRVLEMKNKFFLFKVKLIYFVYLKLY